MLERLFYCWRLLATGLCFVLFGIGGVLFGLVIVPMLKIARRAPMERSRAARSLIRRCFRLFIGVMRLLGVLRYEVEGLPRLQRRGLLILANHPSLIDTVFLMALVEHADGILKADLQKNFFTRSTVTAAGYIFNDQGAELVNDCIRSLQSGSNLIVFPEGTRTAADGVIRLKRGAANIALRAGCNITPVIIECRPKTLGKGEPWWKIPAHRVHFKIVVQEDIAVARFIEESGGEALAARSLTAYLQQYFTEEIQRHA